MLSAQFATLKPTHKLAASAFKYSDWMKVLAASLLVGFCDEWKRALRPFFHGSRFASAGGANMFQLLLLVSNLSCLKSAFVRGHAWKMNCITEL